MENEKNKKQSEAAKKAWEKRERKISESHRQAVINAAKRPRSQAWKDSMSRNRKGKPATQKNKNALKASWDKLNPEERAKRTEKWSQAGTNATRGKENTGWKNWYNSLSDEERYEYMKPWIEAGQKGRGSYEPSKIEDKVARRLESQNINFERQIYVGKYRVDFLLRERNTIIEVFGCFWHQCEKCNQETGYENHTHEEILEADSQRVSYLQSKGYRVIVVWEHTIRTWKE